MEILKRFIHYPIGQKALLFIKKMPIFGSFIRIGERLPITSKIISVCSNWDFASGFFGVAAINTSLNALCAASNVLYLKNLDYYQDWVKKYQKKVTIIVPARNEEARLPILIDCLKKQIGVSNLLVLIIDDESTDRTFEYANQEIGDDSRFILLPMTDRPKGWVGKTAVLEKGRKYLAENNLPVETLVFIDADVELEPDGLVLSLLAYEHSSADLMTIWPKHDAEGILENLFQPFFEYMWIPWAPQIIADRFLRKLSIFSVTMGQFLITDWDTYQAVGGHFDVRRNIMEDLTFGRFFRRKGYRTGIVFGKSHVRCRMYRSWPELREGFTRWLHMFMNKLWLPLFSSILLILNIIGPGAILTKKYRLNGIICYLTSIFGHFSGAIATDMARDKKRWIAAALLPFTTLEVIYLLIESNFKAATSGVTWKGRIFKKNEPEKHEIEKTEIPLNKIPLNA